MPALWKPDLWTSRKAACSRRSRVRSGSRNLRFLLWTRNIPTSMYVSYLKVNRNKVTDSWLPGVLEFCTLSPVCVWKVGETAARAVWNRPWMLFVRHSFSSSEVSRLSCHVIAVNVEHHMLPQWSLSRNFWGVVWQPCSELLERRVGRDVDPRVSSPRRL